MLKVPEHQVAGHSAKKGNPGPLVDDKGHFFKPFPRDIRYEKEAMFYESLSSNKKVPDHILRYFPVYHGTQIIEASDGSGKLPHIVLEDVVIGHSNPSVMDVKMGLRTWYPDASEQYTMKCLKKDRESTTNLLGFKISGFKILSSFFAPDKKNGIVYDVDSTKMALRKFVSSNSPADSIPNCALAAMVYGGSNGILAQLLELKDWFETQTFYHLYSCSILMVYANESEGEAGPQAQVKLVDFAHFQDGNGVIDYNFLGGLCSFINFIKDILQGDEIDTPQLENGQPEN